MVVVCWVNEGEVEERGLTGKGMDGAYVLLIFFRFGLWLGLGEYLDQGNNGLGCLVLGVAWFV